MFDFKKNTFLDNLASTCDTRDQKYLDIHQAKYGFKPVEPLLRDRMNSIDCRNQEWQDIHQLFNTPDFSQVPMSQHLLPSPGFKPLEPLVPIPELGTVKLW